MVDTPLFSSRESCSCRNGWRFPVWGQAMASWNGAFGANVAVADINDAGLAQTCKDITAQGQKGTRRYIAM